MVEGNEPSALPLRLHDVLLGLAGRLDDSALGQARRLAARARASEAAELVAGSLVAGRIPVRATEQRELAEVLAAAGAEGWFAEQLRVDDRLVEDGIVHRFSGGPTAADGIAAALETVLHRLPDVRSVHAGWRNTVAGSVPGPMPQRLVLAEVGPAGSALATAYRMDVALRRAGISAAVEVTSTSGRRGDYHAQALAAADPVWSPDTAAPTAAAAEPEPAEQEPAGERQVAVDLPAVEPEPAPQFAVDLPSVEPAPTGHFVDEVPPAPATMPEPEPEPARPEPEPSPQFAVDLPPVEPEPQPQFAVDLPQARGPEPEPAPEPRHEPEPQRAPEPEQLQPRAAESELEPGELFWPSSEPAVAEPEPEPQREPEPAAAQRREPEPRVETTTELTGSELGQLRSALAKGQAPTKITGAAEATTITGAADPAKTEFTAPAETPGPPAQTRSSMEFGGNDLDNPRLSDRDRELLRELHAELAKREREQAAQVRLNGWEPPGAAR